MQRKIGCGDEWLQPAGKAQSHHTRRRHERTVPQHCRFSLETANTPTKDAKAANHRGMTVGTKKRVGKCERTRILALNLNNAGKPFQIELMHNPVAGGNQPEIGKCRGAPFQEFETLSVLGDFKGLVPCHRVSTSAIDRYQGMIDDEIHWKLWIHQRRIAPALG